MDQTTGKTREQYPLLQNKIIKKTISSTLLWFFSWPLFIFVFGIPFVQTLQLNVLAILSQAMLWLFISTALYMVFQYFYQRWYFATYHYDLTDDYIIIKKGPIAPRELTMPYERVQDVYVDQDVLDRVMGLYDVHLSSATMASGFHAHIDGVGEDSAKKLRDHILAKVHEKIAALKKK